MYTSTHTNTHTQTHTHTNTHTHKHAHTTKCPQITDETLFKVMQYPDLNIKKLRLMSPSQINIYMILCTYLISFIPWPE